MNFLKSAFLFLLTINGLLFSENPKYQIIYINGPSSAGKSTLAEALQQELDSPFLNIGLDRLIDMMPAKINNWDGGPAPHGFSWKHSVDETGHQTCDIQFGPFAKKICDTLKQVVLTMASMNHFIIIDDVAFSKQEVDLWRTTLKDYKVLWIGIRVPLPLLEQREKKRGNRVIGTSRAQYYQVHNGVVYDLEFDSSEESLEKIVRVIKEKLSQ